MNTIITIGRQYGSGGREIGKKIAEKLGIPYFDKEYGALADSTIIMPSASNKNTVMHNIKSNDLL